MLYIREEEIALLRTPGGQQFTEFVDDLIYTYAYISGATDSDVVTNLRTDIPDGGVDTEVKVAFRIDSTGLFGCSTIWQYKARKSRYSRLPSLKREITKKYSRECILRGYGYRLCICDNLTPERKNIIEQELTISAREINPNSPSVVVLSISDLKRLSERFPAFILHFFRPGIEKLGLTLEAWGKNICDLTPKYVLDPAWEASRDLLHKFVDFSIIPEDAVLPISGRSGVGKTRFVY